MSPLTLLIILGAIGFIVLFALKVTRESRRVAQEKSRRIGGGEKSTDGRAD